MTGSLSPVIGVITALPIEAAAVRHVLGEVTEQSAPGDPTSYVTAVLGCGPVVATSLVTTGNPAAADACTHLTRSFPGVRAIVMCGIALGAPCDGDPEQDIRLGDIAVGSEGVVHYGHVRVTDDGTAPRGDPLAASPLLLRGVRRIQEAQERGERPWEQWLRSLPAPMYRRPPAATDPHARKGQRKPLVVYGRIGSGDELLRSEARRNEIIRNHPKLVAIEMEAAGVAVSSALNGRQCLVIRGISDYGDSCKTDRWQPYSALAAASYLRALLDALGGAESHSAASGPDDGWQESAASGTAVHTPKLLDLVNVMEGVSSLQTPGDRDIVLQMMRPSIRNRVARDPRNRPALYSLAHICKDHGSGFDELITVLTGLEGEGSLPVRDLAIAIELFLDGQSS
ncbi:effector-associated domain 2-containing protein [Planomonospora venezuelensis]|uniref:Nucleoside phosphorylase n=1 Tax=Planomonospora venezuelensis TaxID=1999 RepID=A0A841CYU7_PLAVE|nr:5'-methylthioadenosine/S-adenosylhomocysteine nucleosidase [Planomonospora venezuelensis]MBB5961973.1 nucleoside phosphorylase [Planomonospora venezuelensis]GIN00073.1 hypothetical protein Pve01_17310 [Planomonospora venezuelensis]